MPENIRALFFILVIGFLSFHVMIKKRPDFILLSEIKLWKKHWLIITCSAFLSFNYWLFMIITFVYSFFFIKKKPLDKIIAYLIMLPILPNLSKAIPGFGGINYIIQLSYPRLLSFSILLPLFLSQTKKNHFFSLKSDKYLFAFLFLSACLEFRNTTFTDALRESVYLLTDFFLPYYVMSRYIKTLLEFKKIAYAIITVAFIISSIAIIESLKSWHLFTSLKQSLEIDSMIGRYLRRENLLRTTVTFSSPIILGYFIMIAMGFCFAIQDNIKKNQWLFFSILLIAALSTLSRGPWVGMVLLVMVFYFTGKNKGRFILYSLLATIPGYFILLATPMGNKFINLLPFIGNSTSNSSVTVSYRQQLFEKSMIVINRHPWLGSTNYMKTPEMESMRQGQGIIDIVNSYLRITLDTGLIGLTLFVLFFLTLCFRLYLKIQQTSKADPELFQYGRGLLATTLSSLVVISTVSSIDIAPTLYYSLAGMIASFLKIQKLKNITLNTKL